MSSTILDATDITGNDEAFEELDPLEAVSDAVQRMYGFRVLERTLRERHAASMKARSCYRRLGAPARSFVFQDYSSCAPATRYKVAEAGSRILIGCISCGDPFCCGRPKKTPAVHC